MEKRVYSVSQINRYVRNMFARDGFLSAVSVSGEISNCKYHTSGHIYFSLKDAGGAIACVLFAGNRKGLRFKMKDGDKVVVTGNVDVFERDGRYQLYASKIELQGVGLLYEKYLALKQELEEQGLFDPIYKKPIPAYAMRVGVVTAPTGAAVRDIQSISSRRNPYVQLILFPALVQGEGAKESIAEGIRVLDQIGVDVIIVGRGGGSIEDLWAFNEELVARAIFECRTPVISAVGHETDTTIADFAADRRAATPSAAAELAVFDIREFDRRLDHIEELFRNRMERKTALAKMRADRLKAMLEAGSPGMKILGERHRRQNLELAMAEAFTAKLEKAASRGTDVQSRMNRALESKFARRSSRFQVLLEAFRARNPLDRLRQGYSYVENADGRTVRSIKDTAAGSSVTIRVTDGMIMANVTETSEYDR